MAEFIPGFNILDPAAPFLGGSQTTIPMLPGYVPPAQAPLPTLPQWAQQRPSIPAAATAAAAAPGTGTDQQAALLSKILASQATRDPRAAQILAYMQLQQANPGTGPITGLVNPITNALLARRLAPSILEKQRQEDLKNQLELIKAVTGITKTQADTKLSGLRADQIQQAMDDVKGLPPDQQMNALLVKLGLKAGANAVLSSETRKATAADAIAAANQREADREQAASDLLDRKIKQQNDVLNKTQAFQTAIANFKANNQFLSKEDDRKLRLFDIQTKDERAKLGQELRADLGNINNKLKAGQLDYENNSLDQRTLVSGVNNAFRMAYAFDPGQREVWVKENILPVLGRLGMKDVKTPAAALNWWQYYQYKQFGTVPDLKMEPAPGTTSVPAEGGPPSQTPIPQRPVTQVPTVTLGASRVPPLTMPSTGGAYTPSSTKLTPIPRSNVVASLPDIPTGAGGGITGPDTTAAGRTQQENALATPTGRSYSNVPADLQPGAAAAPPQLGPVQVDPTALGVNPNFLYPAQYPYINPPAGTAPTLQDQFNNLFQASDAYMGGQ